ncbi:MAG: polysaccharide deacetylase family protein [Sarcina sp.]
MTKIKVASIVTIVVVGICNFSSIAYNFTYKTREVFSQPAYNHELVLEQGNILDSGSSADSTCSDVLDDNEENLDKSTSSQMMYNKNNMIKSAEKYSVPASRVRKMIRKEEQSDDKIVFLTFDDGPHSVYTPEILRILKNEKVHATFFVLGSTLTNQTNKEILKQEYLQGHAICNHSYSHNFKVLYPTNKMDINQVVGEYYTTDKIMKDILGNQFECKVMRLPGGYLSREYYHDPNLPSLNKKFDEEQIVSIDWNSETGDATCTEYTAHQLVENAKSYARYSKCVVLLMHDIKENTVKCLPELIRYYKNQGYQFRVISN